MAFVTVVTDTETVVAMGETHVLLAHRQITNAYMEVKRIRKLPSRINSVSQWSL